VGIAPNGWGVHGYTIYGVAVRGCTCNYPCNNAPGIGVQGSSFRGVGVCGSSACAPGVHATSVNGPGLCAFSCHGNAIKAVGNSSAVAVCVVGSTASSCNVFVNANHKNNGSSLYPGIVFGGCGSGEGIADARACGSPNQYGIDFYTNHTKRMSVTNSGNVGIGTCAPSSTLCVVGSTSSTGIKVKADFVGVCAASCNVGVFASGSNIGIFAVASQPTGVALVVCSPFSTGANLQQWEIGCVPKSVVNKCGWLGLGATSAPTTLTVGGSVSAKTVAVTSNYKMGASDFAVLASGAIKITLPPASTASGMIVFIKNVSTSTVTVDPFKSDAETDTIEGASSKKLKKQYDSLQLISNGSNEWLVLGNSICSKFTS